MARALREFGREADGGAAAGEGVDEVEDVGGTAAGERGDRVELVFLDAPRLAGRAEDAVDEREVVLGDAGAGCVGTGAGADLHRCVGHGANDARGGMEPAAELVDGDAGGDGENELAGTGGLHGREGAGEDLRF